MVPSDKSSSDWAICNKIIKKLHDESILVVKQWESQVISNLEKEASTKFQELTDQSPDDMASKIYNKCDIIFSLKEHLHLSSPQYNQFYLEIIYSLLMA